MNSSERAVQNAVTTTFSNIVLSLPWVICYFVIHGDVNEADCTDTPYEFGKFARWGYLASIIAVAIMSPCDIYIAKKKAQGDDTPACMPIVQLLKGANGILSTAIWIYACVALSRRDTCQGPSADSYVKLLWATVLFPAIFMGIICCCCCFCLVVAGGAGAFGKNRA